MAHPVSPRLRIHLADAAEAEGIHVVRDGTYVCMEGPQFSTLAESLTYKKLGYSVIGMTNMPEAKLAREAEICYATVAMVTDYDCWHPDHDAVTVQDIIKVLMANADKAKRLVGRLAQEFPARARAVPDRLRPRARHRADHRARGARQEAPQEARRGGGEGAARPEVARWIRISPWRWACCSWSWGPGAMRSPVCIGSCFRHCEPESCRRAAAAYRRVEQPFQFWLGVDRLDRDGDLACVPGYQGWIAVLAPLHRLTVSARDA